jgi:hypothetical protein
MVGTVATDLGDVMVLKTLPTDDRYREATGLPWVHRGIEAIGPNCDMAGIASMKVDTYQLWFRFEVRKLQGYGFKKLRFAVSFFRQHDHLGDAFAF